MKNILFIFLIGSILPAAQGQNLLIKKGHQEIIHNIAYSNDGTKLYSCSEDKTIKEWDIKTGFDTRTFAGHPAPVKSFAITADDKYLISGDTEGNIFIWDINDVSILHKIKAHEAAVNTITFYPDNKRFLTGSDDKKIKEWSLENGVLLKTIEEGISSWVRSIGISPNSKYAIMGGHKANNVELLLLDLEKGIVVDDLVKHWMDPATRGLVKAYTYAVLSPVALTMNVAKGNVGKDMLHFWINDFNNIEFSKDGGSVLVSQNIYLPLTASKDKELEEGNTTVWLIKLADGGTRFDDIKTMRRWIINAPGARAVFNKDQTKVIANEKFAVRIFDYVNTEFPDNLKEAQSYQPPVIQEFKSGMRQIQSIAMSPDYKTVASTNKSNSIDLWDINTGRLIRSLGGEVKSALSVDVLPDGNHILVGSEDQNMALWNISTGQLTRIYDRSSDITYIDVSKDGKQAVTTAQNTEFFKLWDLESGRLIRSFLDSKDHFIWAKFDEDSDYLMAATENREIRRWSVVEGKPKNRVKESIEEVEDKFHRGQFTAEIAQFKVILKNDGQIIHEHEQQALITDAVFSMDGGFLITTNELGQINLYNTTTHKLVITMTLIGFDQFIAYTPDYYYTASKRAANVLAFQKGVNILPFEQLDLRNNRPDIILKRLGTASSELIASYYSAYQKRLKRLGFEEEDLTSDIQLPEVSIDFDKIPFATTKALVNIAVTANDLNAEIKKFNIYINDVPVFGSTGYSVKTPGNTITENFSLELSGGINNIKVSAVNAQGFESLTKSFEITYDKPYFKPQLYILSIGVSDYSDDNFDLTFAAKDATDLAGILSKSTSYEKVNTKFLLNGNATKANILNAKTFLQQAGVDDVVIIFIAGHGVLDKDFTYYFGTYDMDFTSPAVMGLSYELLQALLDGLSSRKKILFMDTCHSGELDAEDVEKTNNQIQQSGSVAFRSGGSAYKIKENSFGLQNTLELSKNLFGDMKKGTGATIISAAGGTEYALEGLRSQNGLFTSCLIQGIQTRRADLNRDRSYSVSEFQNYIYDKVVEYSKGAQSPTSRAENILNDFVIY